MNVLTKKICVIGNLFLSFLVFADEPIEVVKTQFIAPVSTPTWENRVLTGEPFTGAGIAYEGTAVPNSGINYALKVNGVYHYALSKCVTGPDLTFPEQYVRSCLSDNSPATRYLYPASYILNKTHRFNFTGVLTSLALEVQVIANALDSSAGSAAYVQKVHSQNKYRMVYSPNGAEASDVVEDYLDDGTISENTFARTGYLFAGWNTQSDGKGVSYKAGQSVSARNLTLYAQWTPEKRTVTVLDVSGGNGVVTPSGEKQYDYDAACTIRAIPRDGYHFVRWMSDKGVVTTENPHTFTVRDDVIMMASFSPNGYTIDFDGNGGVGVDPREIHAQYDTAIELPENPYRRDGYRFKGWGTTPTSPYLYDPGRQESLNLSAADGANVTLYAVWEVLRYTLYLHANDGTDALISGSAVFGELPDSVSPPSRRGYRFDGFWNQDFTVCHIDAAGQGKTAWTTAADGHLFAKWQANAYIVRFLPAAENVSGGMEDQAFLYGTPQNLRENTLSRRGYVFVGWSTSLNGAVDYSDGQSVSNLTENADGVVSLYAVWKRNFQEVAFDASADAIVVENGKRMLTVNDRYVFGEPFEVLPEAKHTNEKAVFIGWWSSTNLTEAVQVKTNTLVDTQYRQLYARWKIPLARPLCDLAFTAPDATGETSLIRQAESGCEIGAALPAPPVHTNQAFAFFGWFDQNDRRVTSTTLVTADMAISARWTVKAFNEEWNCWDLAFTTDATAGVSPWVVDDGFARSGPLVRNSTARQVSRLQAWAEGPGSLMFEWRVSCRAQSGALTSEYACFDEGDAPLDDLQTENFLTGVTAWESFGAFLPAGGAVTWRYCREFLTAYADAEDAGFLRGVVWTPAATPSGIDGWSNVPLVTNEFPAAKFATADVDGWVVTENADVICATNVADGCSKWVSLTVEGPGVLSFDWRVSCEGGYELTNGVYCAGDFLGLFVDDATNAVARIDGVRPEAYVPVAYTNTASGVRTYRWRYVKDGSDAAGEDAGWLKNVRWTPLATPPATTVVYRDAAGVEREVRVPHAWVDEMGLLPAGSSDYEAALWQPSGKKSADGTALFRWQDYLAGTDPSDLADTLRITRFDVSAGAVSLSWAPDLRSATPPRTYRLWGRERLETGAWTTPTNSTHRFFRLEVLIDE